MGKIETLPRIIVDVDIGNDDYLSLMLLFWAERIGLLIMEMLVCSAGNTSLDFSCRNLVRFLETINRTDVSVYKGSKFSLTDQAEDLERFFGQDGFGDLCYDTSPDLSIIKKEPAAVAMGKLVIENPNQITLIGLAALTNIALTIRLYKNFAKSVKEVWIMGGNYIADNTYDGTAEFNFYADPEAAFITLETIEKPIFMGTWETCQLSNISKEWRFKKIVDDENKALKLLTEADQKVYQDNQFWDPCDAFLIAAFLEKDIIIKKSLHSSSVELCGYQTRGQMVLDKDGEKKNIQIIEKINIDYFKKMLLQMIK